MWQWVIIPAVVFISLTLLTLFVGRFIGFRNRLIDDSAARKQVAELHAAYESIGNSMSRIHDAKLC